MLRRVVIKVAFAANYYTLQRFRPCRACILLALLLVMLTGNIYPVFGLLQIANGNLAAAIHNFNGLQCQRIEVIACQGIGYNMTAMPNLAGHSTQLEAQLKIASLLPLIESSCSSRVRFLFCSSLFPLCTADVPRPVTACKFLCETVHQECSSHTELMHLWPDFLNCDNLSQPEKHELCMQVPEDMFSSTTTIPKVHYQPMANSTNDLVITEVLQGEKLQEQQKEQQQAGNQLQIPVQVMNTHRAAPSLNHFYWPWIAPHMSTAIKPQTLCPHNFTVHPVNADVCVPQCNRDAFHTTQQKKLAENLILVLSAVCFILTLFSLVTFWAEPTRFGYPERPVLFLCFCYNLFSVCLLERIVFHNSTRSFAFLKEMAAEKETTATACSVTPPCLASYITTSYLSLCAATWWLIFSLCFYLSSHKKWSSEALEKKSGLFHVLAWVPPLTPPITALLMEKVKPNELMGTCSAPGFVEIPAILLLLLGLFFTLRTSKSMHVLQQQVLPTLSQQRFSQIRKRFLVFSLVFFIPSMIGVVSTFFEHYPGTVIACSTPEDCTSPALISAWPTLIRLFFQLSGGTLTGMWVWSRKTCESYRSRLTPMSTSSINTTTAKLALTKKHLPMSGKSTIGTPPLYSGINFHNVPVYTSSNQRA